MSRDQMLLVLRIEPTCGLLATMISDMTERKTDLVSALDEMERSARGTLKRLAEIEQTVAPATSRCPAMMP